jgi:transcriptional regulator NrdR family protein
MPLTAEQKAKYLANPNHCPLCQSDRIAIYDRGSDGKTVWMNIQCQGCQSYFTETYTLNNVEAD